MKMNSRALRAGVVLATSLAGVGFATGTGAAETYVRALGPVERIDNSSALTILGQTFSIAPETDAILNGRLVPHAAALMTLLSSANGASVGVLTTGSGAKATRLVVDTQRLYVAGSSTVATAGIVRVADRATASFLVGTARVDYSAVLSTHPEFEVRVGDFVQVVGIRPGSTSAILASSAQLLHEGATQGITGSAVQGITGSARNGITGSAVQGITGSARNGITGSARNGITGSATQGITGSAN